MTQEPVLALGVTTSPTRCRCGTRLPAGSRCLCFPEPPGPLGRLLAEERFCSVVCARAFLLEALALFEGSTAAATVHDAGEVLQALGDLYALATLPVPAAGH